MKKNLVFALLCVFSFAFVLGACSSDGGGKKRSGGFFQNTISGQQIELYPVSNNSYASEDNKRVAYLVQGMTFTFESILWTADPSDPGSYNGNTNAPELDNAIWKITGNIGIFDNGTATSTGKTALFSSSTAGTTGTLSVELNGLKCTYPVKIVASQSDLPV